MRAIRSHIDFAADAMAWFQLDGEPIQLEYLQDSEIIDLMRVNHTCVGKQPAVSITEITQRVILMRFSKVLRRQKRISDADVTINTFMMGRLKEVLKSMTLRLLSRLVHKWVKTLERMQY